jgi:hypothetical protein
LAIVEGPTVQVTNATTIDERGDLLTLEAVADAFVLTD